MPGESIGRFGPLTTWGGRTEGEPCTGLLGMCDDYDVQAWLQQAKHWTKLAQDFRPEIVQRWGGHADAWPIKAKLGELAYNGARDLLAGEQGWLDSSFVNNSIEAQRFAKTALELWFQAVESADEVTLEVDALGYDGLTDPSNLPPVAKPPSLPDLGLGAFLRLAGLGLGVYVAFKVLGGRR